MNLDGLLPTFLVECREVLQQLEEGLLAIDKTPNLSETINGIFRAIHTIKGSAGLLDFEEIVTFTHEVETVLDAAREGRVEMSSELVNLLLLCTDHTKAMVEEVAAGRPLTNPALDAQRAPLLARLSVWSLQPSDGPLADSAGELWDDGQPTVTSPAETANVAQSGQHTAWHIAVRFGREVLRNGMDPLSILQYLASLGEITELTTVVDPAGLVETMDPESCFLGFEISLVSASSRAIIEQAFEFVRDDCRLTILAPGHHSHAQEDAPPSAREVRADSVPERLASNLDGASSAQQTPLRETRSLEGRSIRVDADKLDQLINLVGELIIGTARTEMVGREAHNLELQECTSTLSSLVQRVRDSALQLRMVKIGATLNRFQRIVHDVSRQLGKDIRLVVTGEETELDKTLVEKIADPLLHLVRNAIDHGIESAEQRLTHGKAARGTIKLNAYHDSGSVVIEVSDDGGGLRKDKILAKAVERGLVDPSRMLSDREIHGLIFEPGFSTAEQVTNLSGRGVGMDVVKRNLVALRGSVEVTSQEGVGTTIAVRIPLTLAMINGFLVGLDSSVFVIPLDMIDECLELAAPPGEEYTNLRGQILPLVRLREVFDLGPTAARRESVVVVNAAGRRAGLVVDTLMGEFQTVIKPLGNTFQRVRCIGGATILGSGDVALIVDVPALLEERSGPSRTSSVLQRGASLS